MRNRNRSGKSMLIMLVVITLVVCLVGVGIGIFMSRARGSGKHPDAHATTKKDGHVRPATVYSLGEMVVNLADPNALRYAKLTVAIGFAEKIDDAKLKSSEPAMRDAVIGVITDRRFDELHRRGGVQLLKDEIRKSISEHVPDLKAVEVYLEAFAMQ